MLPAVGAAEACKMLKLPAVPAIVCALSANVVISRDPSFATKAMTWVLAVAMPIGSRMTLSIASVRRSMNLLLADPTIVTWPVAASVTRRNTASVPYALK